MELNKWNVREFKIEDEDGDHAFILYRPITQGWRTRHLEVSLKIQRSFSTLTQQRESVSGSESLTEEQIEGIVKAQSETQRLLSGYQEELLTDLVVGCRGLTIDGIEPEQKALVQALIGMEDIAISLCSHIAEEGSVSEDEGKG